MNILVSFDHHSNIIAAALGLEALLLSENSGQQRQCNKSNRSSLEPCRRDIICPSLKGPFGIHVTEGLDVGPRGFGSLEIMAIYFHVESKNEF